MTHSIGAILKAAREEKGLDLAKIASDLRIRLVYLQELENENSSNVTYNVYKLGYIKIYSNHLGVNLDEHMNSLKKAPHQAHPPVQNLDIVKTRPPMSIIALSLLCLMLTVYLTTYFLNKPDSHSIAGQENSGTHLLKQDNKIHLETSYPSNNLVAILALADTKIEIENKDGKLVEQITLKAKQSHILPNQDYLVITPENPDQIEIYEFSAITMDKKKLEIDGNKN